MVETFPEDAFIWRQTGVAGLTISEGSGADSLARMLVPEQTEVGGLVTTMNMPVSFTDLGSYLNKIRKHQNETGNNQ